MSATDLSKTVFFVTPIGAETSAQRRRSDDLMDFLLEPAVSEVDPKLTVVRADRLAAHGRITDMIVRHLLDSALIVVDATGLNPNVFYELGIAHARHRPVVLIVDNPDAIPFDTKAEAHLILPGDADLGARVVAHCKPKLVTAIKAALVATTPPGPVAAAEATFVPPDISASEATELLRESIASIEARLDTIERHVEPRPIAPDADYELVSASGQAFRIRRKAEAAQTRPRMTPSQLGRLVDWAISEFELQDVTVISVDTNVVVARTRAGNVTTFTFTPEADPGTARHFARWARLGVGDADLFVKRFTRAYRLADQSSA